MKPLSLVLVPAAPPATRSDMDETFDEAEEVRRMERRQRSIERAYVPSPKKCKECGATWNPDNADSCPLCEIDEALRMDDGPEGQEDDR